MSLTIKIADNAPSSSSSLWYTVDWDLHVYVYITFLRVQVLPYEHFGSHQPCFRLARKEISHDIDY